MRAEKFDFWCFSSLRGGVPYREKKQENTAHIVKQRYSQALKTYFCTFGLSSQVFCGRSYLILQILPSQGEYILQRANVGKDPMHGRDKQQPEVQNIPLCFWFVVLATVRLEKFNSFDFHPLRERVLAAKTRKEIVDIQQCKKVARCQKNTLGLLFCAARLSGVREN